MPEHENPPEKGNKSSLITSDKCIRITDENFLYTYCTARDQSQVDGQDIGSLEETAYDFIAKDEAREKTQTYLGKYTYEGGILWWLKNWHNDIAFGEPNSNKLSWKFMNPKKIHLDKIYIKVTKVINKRGREAKGKWKIEIDGEQADCTFDYNYEAEIKVDRAAKNIQVSVELEYGDELLKEFDNKCIQPQPSLYIGLKKPELINEQGFPTKPSVLIKPENGKFNLRCQPADPGHSAYRINYESIEEYRLGLIAENMEAFKRENYTYKRIEKTPEFVKWRMINVDRNKLRRIDVYVNSYGSNAKWFLETDNFETELIDGQTNVIDFKMDLIKKSRLSSLLDAAKNCFCALLDAAENCFCPKDEEQKNKKIDCLTPQFIDLKLKINGDTEEIFNIESALSNIPSIPGNRQFLDPYFDIKLHFEDEVTTDDKDEQESLLIIAIDETSSFLKKWSHTEVRKFVHEIQDNLVKKDNCYYQKLMIIGFGGVMCEPGEKAYLDGYRDASTCRFSTNKGTFYQLYTKNDDKIQGFNHENKCYLSADDIFNDVQKVKIEGSKEPLNSNENNFLTVLTRLLYYVQGSDAYKELGNYWETKTKTDTKFGSMAGNRRASLLIISEMNCLSLDSKVLGSGFNADNKWNYQTCTYSNDKQLKQILDEIIGHQNVVGVQVKDLQISDDNEVSDESKVPENWWIRDQDKNLDTLFGFKGTGPNVFSMTSADLKDEIKRKNLFDGVCDRLKGNVADISYKYKQNGEKKYESNKCEKIEADLSMKKKISVGYKALDVKESLRNKRQKECIIYLEELTGWLTMIVVLLLTVFLIPLSFKRFKPSLDDEMCQQNLYLNQTRTEPYDNRTFLECDGEVGNFCQPCGIRCDGMNCSNQLCSIACMDQDFTNRTQKPHKFYLSPADAGSVQSVNFETCHETWKSSSIELMPVSLDNSKLYIVIVIIASLINLMFLGSSIWEVYNWSNDKKWNTNEKYRYWLTGPETRVKSNVGKNRLPSVITEDEPRVILSKQEFWDKDWPWVKFFLLFSPILN